VNAASLGNSSGVSARIGVVVGRSEGGRATVCLSLVSICLRVRIQWGRHCSQRGEEGNELAVNQIDKRMLDLRSE